MVGFFQQQRATTGIPKQFVGTYCKREGLCVGKKEEDLLPRGRMYIQFII